MPLLPALLLNDSLEAEAGLLAPNEERKRRRDGLHFKWTGQSVGDESALLPDYWALHDHKTCAKGRDIASSKPNDHGDTELASQSRRLGMSSQHDPSIFPCNNNVS
ncbi:uncharacterized protein UV8b_01591 [Ustilaginoidea virens]|uniref:Uncharacterized protein n=1 Tax=Ustilaginoidea virens TaxID=1159556 RepID=A0A8E5HKY2_USTVR|nr:uncharacterized protein UV8b_01591 [Ustilaginoidea virens]QUC17350.1 hypothetical protein UV8b_01591 [Ustilaginoidea virens]